MRHKSTAKTPHCQDLPETPEQKEIRLLKKRLERSKRDSTIFQKYYEEAIEERNALSKKAIENEQLYYKVLYESMKKTLKESENMLRRFELKLIEHDLVPAISKIKIPCDNCRLNGNCRFQDTSIKHKRPRSEFGTPCFGLGPFPLDEKEGEIQPFPFDLVDASITEEILN